MNPRLEKLAKMFRFVIEPEDTSASQGPAFGTPPYVTNNVWVGRIKVLMLIIIAIAVAIQVARLCI